MAEEGYTYLALHMYNGFATHLSGRILPAWTYPLQEVDAEEGDGH